MSQTNAGNHKYEITDIVHEKYPFLHRIRALRDIGSEVKAGDLGGFVEAEWNLSYEDSGSWIFDDAIAANTAYVCEDASLREQAIACGNSAIRQGAVLSGHARVEDTACVSGALVEGYARVSSRGIIAPYDGKSPVLTDGCVVFGMVTGNVRVAGSAVILGDEKIFNDAVDRLVITEEGRSVEREPFRDELTSLASQVKERKKPRGKGLDR